MKRYILAGTPIIAIALAVVFVFASPGFGQTEHGFCGNVTYSNCTCGQFAYADEVYIQELPDGIPDVYYPTCRSNEGWYDTEEMSGITYPPGEYKITLKLHDGSDCEVSTIKYVTHGYSKQQVDLAASAPKPGT
jgi:hypothetical protein